MTVSEKQAVSIDELLSSLNSRKEESSCKTTKKARNASNNFPVGMILFVFLIAALGIMVIMLKTEVVSLKTEITDLRNLKTQIAESEHKIKIAVIEGKLEESEKEKQMLKNQLVQIKNDLEELKNLKTDKKRFAQR